MESEFRRTPLLALLGANAISMTGNVMALVAVPWFVLQTTGSAALTGVAAFLNFLPTVLAGFFGGTLIDRLGYKKMSVVADVASGVTIALVPLLYSTVGIEFWQLLVLIFLGGLMDAPGTTARAALVPDVARHAGWSLEAASGASAASERGSHLLGSPLAGVMIVILGPTNVLWADAATFGLSAVMVALAVPGRPGLERRDGEAYFAQLREGWSFLLSDRLLRAIVFTVTVTNFLDAIAMILLPVYAKVVFGDAVSLGLLLGAAGGGAVVGALLFARWGSLLSRRTVFALCFVGVVGWYPVFAFFPSLPVAIAAKALSGLCAGPLNPIIDTIGYERVPSEIRGRVLGVIMAAAWMSIPLGVLIGGLVLETIGLRITLIVTGSAYLATTTTLWFNRAIKNLDSAPGPAKESMLVS